jgi:hypothetical protein
MRLDKSRFTASHGREPGGFGLWIFEHGSSRNRFEFTGSYGDAVAALRRHADELATATPLPNDGVWFLLP